MRKFGVFFGIISIFVFFLNIKAISTPSVSAASAVLMNAENGDCIFEKAADIRRGMASTTKIMTALVAIENGDLDSTVQISKAAVGVEGSSLYLKQGEIFTLKELLYGLMLRSANDAAVAIAIHVGGSLDGFVELMNEKANALGLDNTHFTNPHGLADDMHYTTARDLASLASYAVSNDTFKEICSAKSASISGGRTVVNHNKLLFSFNGAFGVKTGFTKATGRCLVSAAERDGVILTAVTLNAPDDWKDHNDMLEYGFLEYEHVSLSYRGDVVCSIPVIGGDTDSVNLTVENDIDVCLKKQRGSIIERIEVLPSRFAPIYKGEVLGRIVYFLDGREIASASLVSSEFIGARKPNPSFTNKIKSIFG